MVVWVGETFTEPEVAPPVEKFTPEQVVALVEDQERVELCPLVIETGFAVKDAVGSG